MKKKDYNDFYYIKIFEDKDKNKNYRVIASIDSYIHSPFNFPTEREYHISKIYWPNGGYITFKEVGCDKYNSLSVGKKVYCEDDDSRW